MSKDYTTETLSISFNKEVKRLLTLLSASNFKDDLQGSADVMLLAILMLRDNNVETHSLYDLVDSIVPVVDRKIKTMYGELDE